MASLDGWDLGRYRAYLCSRARLLRLDPRVRRRFDESDLVQETLLRATASREPCRGQSDREKIAWLERIQDRVLIDKWREHIRKGADVRREEQGLLDALAGSSMHWEENIAASGLSPSEEVERQELFLRVMSAIQQLTEEQQDVVMTIHILQLSPEEAAQRLGKSKGAVAALFHRGIKRLRQLLQDSQRD